MSDRLFIENEILIHAPIGTVWELLVDPDQTKLYMYGCEVICDWAIGDPILWKGSTDEVIYVKGELLALDPGKTLAYSVIDPHGNYPDIPENYLTVTYRLSSEGGGTRFQVTQGDYSKVEEGDKRYLDSKNAGGWQSVLEKIKEIAEATQ